MSENNNTQGHEPLDLFTIAAFLCAIIVGGLQGLILGFLDLQKAVEQEKMRVEDWKKV